MFKTKLQQGNEYENFIKSIIHLKYKNCWLWNEVPKTTLQEIGCINDLQDNCDDIGCDIVCQLDNNSYEFIQCKNYSTTGCDNTINICDLSGFYNFIAETGFKGIVYYSGKLSQQILCRKKKINYINVPHIKENLILDFTPRDYQIEAFNTLKNEKRSVLSMPCGTGKTFVSFLLSLDYKNIIILTPLISTTEQILNHYKNYYSKYENVNFHLINCKATRNVKDFKDNNKNIIASTYDSCDVINKLLINNKIFNCENTLIIIDEFHNLSSNMLNDRENEVNKILINDYKIVFISATPKINLKNNIDNIFGTIKYELDWKQAIENKYICDYNFYYPNNEKIIETLEEIKFDKSLIEKTILINKSYFLLESIKTTNIKKCIVYLKSIKESKDFIKVLKTINLYFNLNIKIYEINYTTTKSERNKSLNKFKFDESCISILCNVHILDEGIDIPECDSIFLTHPNNNPINLIQRISRANRIDIKNKDKIARVFLWSKEKIKLENIINIINKIIDIKYGSEESKYFNNLEKNNIIDNNINNDFNLKEKNEINNDFINLIKDLYENGILKIYSENNLFKIEGELNFDIKDQDIAKYLGITLHTLRKRLSNEYSKTKKFFENVDFIKVKTGINSGVNYMCNYQCFEKLAMSGDSKKSESIKIYFVKIRQFLSENQKLIYQIIKK